VFRLLYFLNRRTLIDTRQRKSNAPLRRLHLDLECQVDLDDDDDNDLYDCLDSKCSPWETLSPISPSSCEFCGESERVFPADRYHLAARLIWVRA